MNQIVGQLELQFMADLAQLRLDMNKAVGIVEGATKQMQAAWATVKNAIGGLAAAWLGMRAVMKVADLIKDMALLSARFETMGIVMKVAGNNAGYTADQMNSYADSLRKSGISMLESRDAVVQLATANIDLANANALGRAAQDLAVVGQINSSEALQRMIAGIKVGHVEILRTLGLNIQFQTSYEKMADQLGKNTDQLTEQEKVMARTNVVLEEAAKYQGIYEQSMETAGKAMTSLTRLWEDFKVMAGDAFLPTLTELVFGLKSAFDEMNASLKESKTDIDGAGKVIKDVLVLALQSTIGPASVVVMVFGMVGKTIAAAAAQFAAFVGIDVTSLASWKKGLADITTIGDSWKRDMAGIYDSTVAFNSKLMELGEKKPDLGLGSRKPSENETMQLRAAEKAANEAGEKTMEREKALLKFKKSMWTEAQKAENEINEQKAAMGLLWEDKFADQIRAKYAKRSGDHNKMLDVDIAQLKAHQETVERMTKEELDKIAHLQKIGKLSELEVIDMNYVAEKRALEAAVATAEGTLAATQRKTKNQKELVTAQAALEKAQAAVKAGDTKHQYELEELAAKNTKESNEELRRSDEELEKELKDLETSYYDMWKAAVYGNQATIEANEKQIKLLQKQGELIGLGDKDKQIALGRYKNELDYLEKIEEYKKPKYDTDRQSLNDQAAVIRDQNDQLVVMNATLTEQEQIWSQIEKTAHDTFINIFDQGQDVFKRLGETIKSFVLELLYQMTVKKWMISIQASVMGSLGQSAVGSVVGGGGGGTSLLGSAGSAASLLSGGSSLLGGSATGAFTQGLSSTMFNGVFSGFGANMSNIGTLMGGGQFMAGIGAAMPYVGLAVAAFSILSSMFKGGGPKQGAYIGAPALSGPNAVGAMDSASKEWSDKLKSTLDSLTQQFNSVSLALGGKTGAKFGLGVSTDPEGTSPSFAEVTVRDAAGKAIYANADTKIGRSSEELATRVSEMTLDALIVALNSSGVDQAYMAYFTKISANLDIQGKQDALAATVALAGFDKALKTMGSTFAALSNRTLEAKAHLAELSGGIEQLGTNLTAYYDNFYSEEEKRAITAENIAARVRKAGIDVSGAQVLAFANASDVREQFRAMVDGYMKMGDAGDEALAALLEIAGALAGIVPAANNAAESLVSVQDDLQAAYDDTVRALDEVISKQDEVGRRYRDYARTLRDFRDSLLLGDLSPLTPGERYTQARAKVTETYNAAMSGDQNAMGQLQGDVQAFLQASREYNASSDQYLQDFASVQSYLTLGITKAEEAGAWAEQQASDARASRENLDSIAKNLLPGIGIAVASIDAAMQRFLTLAAPGGASGVITQSYSNLLGRPPTTPEMNNWLTQAIGGAREPQLNASLGTSSEFAEHVMAQMRAGDIMGAYNDMKSTGMTMAELDVAHGRTPGEIEAWARYNNLAVFDRGTDFVPRSGFAFLHKGENIAPANSTSELARRLDIVAAKLDDLRREMVAATYDAHSRSANAINEGSSRQRFEKSQASKAKVTV